MQYNCTKNNYNNVFIEKVSIIKMTKKIWLIIKGEFM